MKMADMNEREFYLIPNEFLEPHLQDVTVPVKHLKNVYFLWLCACCARGNPDAMKKMADYFFGLYRKSGDFNRKQRADSPSFYECASHFWRYRASVKGNAEAQKWIDEWKAAHPGKKLPSILPENLHTCHGMSDIKVSGQLLNALGFLQFNPRTEYVIGILGSDGLVMVSTFVEHEEADDDGFGEQWLYDWWLVDEYLNKIPGVKVLKKATYSEVFDTINWKGKYRKEALEALRASRGNSRQG